MKTKAIFFTPRDEPETRNEDEVASPGSSVKTGDTVGSRFMRERRGNGTPEAKNENNK